MCDEWYSSAQCCAELAIGYLLAGPEIQLLRWPHGWDYLVLSLAKLP